MRTTLLFLAFLLSVMLTAQTIENPTFKARAGSITNITSEKESPQTAYDSYAAKNLKGEASYRVSETDFNYLRELFKFV